MAPRPGSGRGCVAERIGRRRAASAVSSSPATRRRSSPADVVAGSGKSTRVEKRTLPRAATKPLAELAREAKPIDRFLFLTDHEEPHT